MSASAVWAALATSMTSTSARPHDGQAMRSRPLRSRRPSASSSCAAGPGLLDRVGGERVADGVADALAQQRGQAGGGLDEPGRRRPGLGDPEVQRVVDGVGELAVGLDHDRHVRRLDRDLHVVEVDLAEVVELALGRLDQRLGRDRVAVLLVELGVERATVDADADRHAAVLALARHGLDVLGPADVAGVEPQARHAGVERLERPPVLVVDVGDDRHRRAGHDGGQALGRLDLVARAAHDVGARPGQGVDLLQRALDVGRLGGGHRLHRDRGPATDGDPVAGRIADHQPTGLAPGVAHGPPNGLAAGSDHVEVERAQPDEHEDRDHGVGQRHELGGVGPVGTAGDAATDGLVGGDGGVATVEGQQRGQVDQPEEQVDHGQQEDHEVDAGGARLAAEADHAEQRQHPVLVGRAGHAADGRHRRAGLDRLDLRGLRRRDLRRGARPGVRRALRRGREHEVGVLAQAGRREEPPDAAERRGDHVAELATRARRRPRSAPDARCRTGWRPR